MKEHILNKKPQNNDNNIVREENYYKQKPSHNYDKNKEENFFTNLYENDKRNGHDQRGDRSFDDEILGIEDISMPASGKLSVDMNTEYIEYLPNFKQINYYSPLVDNSKAFSGRYNKCQNDNVLPKQSRKLQTGDEVDMEPKEDMSNRVRDVIIIGSGPSGYTAGMYTAR